MILLKDFDTLEEAKAYTITTVDRIQGAEAKTAVETVNVFNGTRDRLSTFAPNPALAPEQQAQASLLAGMIVKAFDNLFKEEFYLQLENPQIQQAYQAALALGVLTQVEYDGILKAATTVSTPFKNATLHDFAVAKDDQARFKEVPNSAINDKWLTLTWAGEFEAHRPSVYFVQGGKKRRLTSFPLIESAGTYECFVNNNQNLFVDDVYSAVV